MTWFAEMARSHKIQCVLNNLWWCRVRISFVCVFHWSDIFNYVMWGLKQQNLNTLIDQMSEPQWTTVKISCSFYYMRTTDWLKRKVWYWTHKNYSWNVSPFREKDFIECLWETENPLARRANTITLHNSLNDPKRVIFTLQTMAIFIKFLYLVCLLDTISPYQRLKILNML